MKIVYSKAERMAQTADLTLVDHDILDPVAREANIARVATLIRASRRHGNARARQWERANTSEDYANSPRCAAGERKLRAQGDAIDAKLAGYGLRLQWYGLYPCLQSASSGITYAIYYDGE